jgi:hypothetical protein
MSPANAQVGPDTEDMKRAVSPPGTRTTVKHANGNIQQPFPNTPKGKPTRPKREDDERPWTADPPESPGEGVPTRERKRTLSLDQTQRAKSPTNSVAGRSMSPNHVIAEPYGSQPNFATVVEMNGLAARARSPSPVIDRTKPPPDAFYRPVPGSPISNGFSNARPGSSGNVTADLLRDLKSKEAEVEVLKKKEVWMKAALSKASRSGFICGDSELGLGAAEQIELNGVGDQDDSGSDRRMKELVVNFKQFRAQIQVRRRYRLL